jgi:hypothetical protein
MLDFGFDLSTHVFIGGGATQSLWLSLVQQQHGGGAGVGVGAGGAGDDAVVRIVH